MYDTIKNKKRVCTVIRVDVKNEKAHLVLKNDMERSAASVEASLIFSYVIDSLSEPVERDGLLKSKLAQSYAWRLEGSIIPHNP